MSTHMPRQVQFTGRSREKAQILEALETHFLVMICGIAGIGKTALATEVAQQWKCRAADRQIAWISANDQTLDGGQVLNSFDAFLNAVARELDRPGLDAPTEEKIEELRKELGRRSCLLVVDSFEVINDEGGQISGFLANVPEPTKCLLTSRHLPLQLQDHPVIVRLGGMPLNETKELMESEAELVSLSLRGVSEETLEELQERIGGHPLAVRWIVGQMHQTGQSLPTVLSRIPEGSIEKKLDDMFSYAYGLLKPEAERILTILPVFGGPVLKEAIMYVGKISRSELDEGLAQLIGLSLVDMDDTVAKDRRCSIHPLTRQYANKLLRRSGTLYREAHLREAQWIIQFVAQLNPQTSTAPREQFELEMPNILSIAQWCSDNREWLALVDLVTATHHQMWEYGYRAEELRLDLLGFDASAQCGRYDAMWRTAYNIGWSEYRRGDYEKANEWATKAEQAIEDTSRLEVSPRVVDHLRAYILLRTEEAKANELERSGAPKQAERLRLESYNKLKELMLQALSAFQKAGMDYDVASVKTHLGEIELFRRNYGAAKEWFEEVLHDVEHTELRNVLSWTWGNLGDVFLNMRDQRSAEEYYHKGLKLAEEIGRDTTIAYCKRGLGLVAMDRGDNTRAREWLLEALAIFQRQDRRRRIREIEQVLSHLDQESMTTGISSHNQGTGMIEADATYCYDVFISYSHDDKDWVRDVLLPRLESEGLRVCIDYRDFEPGAPSLTEMERAVLQSRKTLLVLTPDSLASEWAEFENILAAILDPAARRRHVIPLLLKPCELPLRIRALTYLDFTKPDEIEFQFQRLVAGIRGAAPGAIGTPPVQAATRPTPAFDRVAEGTFSFPGTPEQFVNWLRGNVRPGLWKASPGDEVQTDTRRFVPVADYDAMLRERTDIHIYPFEPPLSLDFPVTLQIKGRVSWTDPEHDGAQKHSDLHVLIQFKIMCPIPEGIKVRVECFDSAARYYLDALLARLREDWGKRTEKQSERAALEQELSQRKGNLYKLRQQTAIYAAGETPLHLLNQIEAEEMEIRRIEEQLRGLERGGN